VACKLDIGTFWREPIVLLLVSADNGTGARTIRSGSRVSRDSQVFSCSIEINSIEGQCKLGVMLGKFPPYRLSALSNVWTTIC
jgi:hypothetical protein